jgi:hypothetical protein
MKKEPRKYTLDDVLPPHTIDDVIDFDDEDEAVEFWEREIDSLFERLYSKIGRKLTKEEYYGVLDIVEEFSPKNSDGDICGPYYPFGRAWQIYQYRKEHQNHK